MLCLSFCSAHLLNSRFKYISNCFHIFYSHIHTCTCKLWLWLLACIHAQYKGSGSIRFTIFFLGLNHMIAKQALQPTVQVFSQVTCDIDDSILIRNGEKKADEVIISWVSSLPQSWRSTLATFSSLLWFCFVSQLHCLKFFFIVFPKSTVTQTNCLRPV